MYQQRSFVGKCSFPQRVDKTHARDFGIFQTGNAQKKLAENTQKAGQKSMQKAYGFLNIQKAAKGIGIEKRKAEKRENRTYGAKTGKIRAAEQKGGKKISGKQPCRDRPCRKIRKQKLGTITGKSKKAAQSSDKGQQNRKIKPYRAVIFSRSANTAIHRDHPFSAYAGSRGKRTCISADHYTLFRFRCQPKKHKYYVNHIM